MSFNKKLKYMAFNWKSITKVLPILPNRIGRFNSELIICHAAAKKPYHFSELGFTNTESDDIIKQ